MRTVQQAVKHANGFEHTRVLDGVFAEQKSPGIERSEIHVPYAYTTGPRTVAPGRRSCCVAITGYPLLGLPGGGCGASTAATLFNVQHVYNNPVNRGDPSGHVSCSNANVAEGDCSDLDTDGILESYGVTLTGEELTAAQKTIILKAVRDVGKAFSRGKNMTKDEAFKAVYGYMEFEKCGNQGCRNGDEHVTSGMITYGAHKIGIASFSWNDARSNNNVVHELGHAFDNVLSDLPTSRLAVWQNENPALVRQQGDRTTDYGFASTDLLWSVALADEYFGSSGEEFADMFLGWVYGQWSSDIADDNHAGPRRAYFMARNMAGWVNSALNP